MQQQLPLAASKPFVKQWRSKSEGRLQKWSKCEGRLQKWSNCEAKVKHELLVVLGWRIMRRTAKWSNCDGRLQKWSNCEALAKQRRSMRFSMTSRRVWGTAIPLFLWSGDPAHMVVHPRCHPRAWPTTVALLFHIGVVPLALLLAIRNTFEPSPAPHKWFGSIWHIPCHPAITQQTRCNEGPVAPPAAIFLSQHRVEPGVLSLVHLPWLQSSWLSNIYIYTLSWRHAKYITNALGKMKVKQKRSRSEGRHPKVKQKWSKSEGRHSKVKQK